ncbi:MAG TPA: aminopeptidase P family protein [Firmicutes bacterium]|nr:aminopeptidase P family protein [Bacillota bacterium]
MGESWLWKEAPSYYCGDELHRVKQDRIQRALETLCLDGIILVKSEAVRYITDFYVKGYRPFMDPEYFAVVLRGRKPIVGFSSGSDAYRIQVRSDIEDHRKLPGLARWHEVIAAILRDNGLTQGRIGADLLPFHLYLKLKEMFPAIEFVDASEIWSELTVVKHPIEIALIKEALAITEIGLRAAMDAIRPGVREYEVAAAAEYAMRKQGSEMEPFITNIASGVNACIFERISTDKRIREGELVIVDLGAVYRGYTGDLGRTVCVGKPKPQQREIYKVVYEAIQAAINAVKPGVTCAEVDAAAREVIASRGYAKYEHKFATGHQLGYGLHGEPAVNKGVDFVLKPGMVMALEPRVTVYDDPEVGGVHLEEAVLVTESGHQLLSHCRFEEELLS